MLFVISHRYVAHISASLEDEEESVNQVNNASVQLHTVPVLKSQDIVIFFVLSTCQILLSGYAAILLYNHQLSICVLLFNIHQSLVACDVVFHIKSYINGHPLGRTCFSTPLGRIIIFFNLYHITVKK